MRRSVGAREVIGALFAEEPLKCTVAALIVLTVVASLAYTAISLAWSEWRFDRDGVRAEGTVVGKGMTISRRPSGITFVPWYHVGYAFLLPDGQVIMAEGRVIRSVYESLEDRGPVPVEYLRDQPNVNRIGASFWGRCAWWWPTVLTILLAVIVFRGWRVWREAAAALRTGA